MSSLDLDALARPWLPFRVRLCRNRPSRKGLGRQSQNTFHGRREDLLLPPKVIGSRVAHISYLAGAHPGQPVARLRYALELALQLP